MTGETQESEDAELTAISTLLSVLGPLEPDARNNVIEYVFRRLGIVGLGVSGAGQPPSPQPAMTLPPASPPSQQPLRAVHDLRSLREEKNPKGANQMVAVLAYYLENLAPADQRRNYVVADDIKKFFPQANFPLPTFSHSQALGNAKNAGYLDALGDGQYRLNPVGHNLVVHKLPLGDLLGTRPKRPVRKAAKKKGRARK
jgi:hypothetical protein